MIVNYITKHPEMEKQILDNKKLLKSKKRMNSTMSDIKKFLYFGKRFRYVM